MASLTGTKRRTSYTWLLHASGPGPLHATTPRTIVLGDGSETPLSLTTTKLYINGVEITSGLKGDKGDTGDTGADSTVPGPQGIAGPNVVNANTDSDGTGNLTLASLTIGGVAVVLANDAALTNPRPASDVYAWAKGENKPEYSASEIADIGDASVLYATGAGETAKLIFGTGVNECNISSTGITFGSTVAALLVAKLCTVVDEPTTGTLSITSANAATYNGKIVRFTGATALTLTIEDTIPAGFNMAWQQVGAGQVTFTQGSGVSFHSFGNLRKTGGQYAAGSLWKSASGIFGLGGSLTT